MNCYNKIFQRRITIKSINKNNGDQIRFNRYLKFSRLLNDIRYYRSWKKKKKKKIRGNEICTKMAGRRTPFIRKIQIWRQARNGQGGYLHDKSIIFIALYLFDPRQLSLSSPRFTIKCLSLSILVVDCASCKNFRKTIECLRIMKKARSIVLKFTSHGMWSNLIVQRSENI